ncbi:heterodisulfide reductase-related iron-sulfur binding cluster [Maridesulfovibrio frigidus]|uniref:heterodisulfide reductase-related iron-sulfur binding cluster n=1 Tax=Maridesulfovibrio frigidus TaxID=340956 RepID=UPI0004E1F6A2|nr:heterodisulfide reductase-related iron-sulfur binding cluster [Maridesulfovibrio frigidus]
MPNKTYFNPGCALSLYKPEMENTILAFLNQNYKETSLHKTCCRHDPQLEKGSMIINICAGCDKRFSSLYEGVSTISLWEVIDSLDSFNFPDYLGLKMSVHDACPVRDNSGVHQAVRRLLNNMNVETIETKFNKSSSVCCGDDFYPKLPVEKVHKLMKKRADSMPCDDVCVYCVSCIKSLYIGGKTPRHLADLLLNESTTPQEYDTEKWHAQLQEYIDRH